MVREHRIGNSRQCDIARHDPITHALESPLCAQANKLRVKVEHDCRMGKAPRRTRGIGVQPNRKIRLAAKAEREVRIFGVCTDGIVVALAQPVVLVGERL